MCALMDRQTADNTKRLVASGKVAFVRTLLRMRSHMLCERAGFTEALVARRTFIRAIACMCLDVSEYFLFLREFTALHRSFTAYPATLVFGFSRANMHLCNVCSQFGVCVEAALTIDPATRMPLPLPVLGWRTKARRRHVVERLLFLA